MRLVLIGLVVAGLAGACVHRRRSVDGSASARHRALDDAWDQRVLNGVEPAVKLAKTTLREAPHDPAVSWRAMRAQVGLGLATPDRNAARAAFAEGREIGVACLDGDEVFAQLRRELGWARAVKEIDTSHTECLVWLTFSWVRWLDLVGGDAGAIDLDALDALVGAMRGRHTRALILVPWSAGLLAAVRPTNQGRDLAEAALRLDKVIELDDSLLNARVDRLLLVQIPRGDKPAVIAAERAALTAAAAPTPEDKGAIARLERAFGWKVR